MALIPPFFLDCVVAIGVADGQGKKRWVASGFLYGHFLHKIDDTNSRYRVYLVSNRHVLDSEKKVYLRFNPKGTLPTREYELDIEQSRNAGVFKTHPDTTIDLAAASITPAVLRAHDIQFDFFRSESNVVNKQSLRELGITEGDSAYILGFPMGIVGAERSFVIVRHGTIARIRDYIIEASKEILVDCMIFPGNSGGPVVTKPEIVAIQGTKSQAASHLIGVVVSYIPYQDIALSQQTGRPRVVFEDNSGLASIVPIQFLVDLIESMQPHPDPELIGIAAQVPGGQGTQ
jgi:S1-C subfamily serine protease